MKLTTKQLNYLKYLNPNLKGVENLTIEEASALIKHLLTEKNSIQNKIQSLQTIMTKVENLEAPTDKWGRKHGWESGIGNGAIHYTYGVMDYCDDGNGNDWYEGD